MATASQTIEIYNAILQRDPSDAELASFVANSQTSEGEANAIDVLVNSSETNSFVAPIVRLYQATFGRVPDAAGLDFWSDFLRAQVEGGAATFDVLTTINAGFAASTEFEARFPEASSDGIVDETFLTALYQQTFGRDPSDADIEFYVGTQISATLSAFAQSSETIDMFDGYVDLFLTKSANGTQDFSGSLLDADDDGDVDQDDMDAVDGGVDEGQNFVLTDAVGEQVLGTNADDTFSGVVGTDSTFNVGDSLNGASGSDTFNLIVAAGATALPAGATVQNIETVNITYASTGGLGDLNSSYFQGATAIWQIDNNAAGGGTFEDITVGSGVTAGFRSTGSSTTDVAVGNTVTAADGIDTVSVALDGVANTSAVTVAETTDEDVSTVNVSGSVVTDTGANTLDVIVGANTDIDTLNLALTSNTTVDISDFVDVTAISAMESTGNLTLDASASVELETFVGGSGNDTLTADLTGRTSETLSVSGNAGNDTLVLAQSVAAPAANVAVTLTGGEGNDTFDITLGGTLGNIVDASEDEFESGLITIADFNPDEDVLDISDLNAPTTLNNTQLANLAAEGSLFDALGAAADIAQDATLVFEYGSDVVIYQNNGTDNDFDAGDGVVVLTGTSLSDFDSANYFTA